VPVGKREITDANADFKLAWIQVEYSNPDGTSLGEDDVQSAPVRRCDNEHVGYR